MKRKIFIVFYGVYVLFVLYFAHGNPGHSWDTIPYSAILFWADGYAFEDAHVQAYDATERVLDEQNMRRLKEGTEYRNLMYTDTHAFKLQMPFYTVKPAFLGASFLLYKCGISAPDSLVWVSLISVAILAIVLIVWLGAYYDEPAKTILAILILSGAGGVFLAGLAKPDTLLAVTLFSAFFLLLEQQSIKAFATLMLVAIAVRPDSIIIAWLTFAGIWFVAPSRLSWRSCATLLIASFVVFVVIGKIAGGYGWYKTLEYFFFDGNQKHPTVIGGSFSLYEFVRMRYWDFLAWMNDEGFRFWTLFLALGVIGTKLGSTAGDDEKSGMLRLALCAVLLAIFFKFVLWPQLELRFYAPYYVLLLTLFANLVAYTNHSGVNVFTKSDNPLIRYLRLRTKSK